MIKTYFNGKAAIWDDIAAEKDNSKLKQMAARLDIRPGSVVLDVGTGTGVFLPFLLQSIGVNGKILAVDIAEEMLRKAKEKSFNGTVAYLNAGKSFPGQSFKEYLEDWDYHVPQRHKNLIREIARLFEVDEHGPARPARGAAGGPAPSRD